MPRAEIYEDRIDVHTTWSEKDLIRQVPGAKYDGRRQTWTVPLSWAACQQLRGVFGATLDSGPQLSEWAWREYEERVRPATELRNITQLAGQPEFMPHQLADIKWMLTAGDSLLGNEPGTGKTVSALTATRCLRDMALPMLIICPNSVKRHWYRHFHGDPSMRTRPWYPEATPYLITGGVAGRRKALLQASQDPTAAIIINIEAVRLHSRLAPYGAIRLKRCAECKRSGDEETELVKPNQCEVHLKELNKIPFKTVIIDEAHRIKDPQSKQTRAIWQLARQESVNRRWALTGTPIANHVGDLWSIMHAVAPHEYPTRSEFLDRYALFVWNVYGTMDIADVRPDTRDELYRFLDARFRRMLLYVVSPNMPPVIHSVREAEMSPQQAKMYAELEKKMYTRTADGKLLLTTNNLTKSLRLLQLASSSAEVEIVPPVVEGEEETWNVRLVEPSSKIDLLEEELDALEGRQVLVSAMSRQLIELAAARLEKKGHTIGLITGKVSEFDRNQNIEMFQQGKIRVLLFTLGAGGVGIDMTAANTMVRLQRSYSMLDNIQGLGRMKRTGAEHHDSLHIIDIIAGGTVEEDQLERIREKEERLETITRDRVALANAGQPVAHLDAEYEKIRASHVLPPMRGQG